MKMKIRLSNKDIFEITLKRSELLKFYKIIICIDFFIFILIAISAFMCNHIDDPYSFDLVVFFGFLVVLTPFDKLKKMRSDDEIILSNKDIVDKILCGELRDYIGKPLFLLFMLTFLLILLFILNLSAPISRTTGG